MTVIAADAPREEKQKWLLRPIDWVGNVAMFGGFGTLMMLYGGVDHTTVLVTAVGANVVNFVLQAWAIKRIRVASGQ